MDVNEAINSIVDQMDIFRPAMLAEYFVIYHREEFQIVDYRPMNRNIPIIAKLTRKDINEGLMSPGWDKLCGTIARFVNLNHLSLEAN